jgi:amino acid permease
MMGSDSDQQQFVRILGQRDVIALAFGAMIGFGWVVLSGEWLTSAGASVRSWRSSSAVWSWSSSG